MLTFTQFQEAVNKEGFHHNLVVYHGTSHDFPNFKPSVRHQTTPSTEVPGHYFTSDELQAHSYANRSQKVTGKKRKVVKAHLHLENPYDATKEIKKHQRKGLTFSEAKRKVYHSVDQTKHDGVYHNGDSINHSEYVVFHGHEHKIKVI